MKQRFLTWTKEFAVGHSGLDAEHRQLVDAIKRVRGVGDVKNFTAQDYAMRVWLRPDKLAALGLI